jgi:UDP-arabinose 4-epimerase
MSNRTVLVTGGAGYVGAHCCKAFAESGWNVHVYDNLSRGWRDFVKWGPLHEGDILDLDRLTVVLQAVKPDVVAHFAALAYVGESVKNPASYYRINTAGTLTVLDAMRNSATSKILFSSTCATYGIPAQVPITEDQAQGPINPYGSSKLFVEKIIRDFGSAYEIDSVILRYFNAAGADQSLVIGERHSPETHAIPLALEAALKRETFQIFGSDYATSDGTAVRDYVHVSDLADAHVRAALYLCSNNSTSVFNLGTGQGTSVLALTKAIEAMTNLSLNTHFAPRRLGDPAILVAAADRAREVLGWIPIHSDINTIVRDAWGWMQKDRRV